MERMRIELDLPTMYVVMTPALQEAYDRAEEEDDWQPLIDTLYGDLEDHFMSEFTIEDVDIVNW